MNPNWLGIISAVLTFAAFFAVYRAAKDQPVQKRVLFSSLAMVAAIPRVSFAAYYAHVLPEPEWYFEFRSVPGTEFLIVFLGLAGGLVATLLPRVLLIVSLLGVTAFASAPIIKPFIGPIPANEFKNKWDGEVCLQSTPSTCGAASTATILRMFGADVNELDLAAEAHSYSGGTEAWYLARAARSRGFDVRFNFASGFLPERGLPAIVGVRLGSVGHFIAILGQDGGRFIVGDPLSGRELLSQEELMRRYQKEWWRRKFLRDEFLKKSEISPE